MAEIRIMEDLLGERHRLACEPQGPLVELLRQQCAVARENQESIGVLCAGIGLGQVIDSSGVDRRDAELMPTAHLSRRVQKAASVREEPGPVMPEVIAAWVNGGRGCWRAALIGHTLQNEPGSTEIRVEHNRPVPIPRAAGAKRRIAQISDRAADDVDLLQLSVREEPKLMTIWRPERKGPVVSSCQRLRDERPDCAHPQT